MGKLKLQCGDEFSIGNWKTAILAVSADGLPLFLAARFQSHVFAIENDAFWIGDARHFQ
jgi:hypothetical protein